MAIFNSYVKLPEGRWPGLWTLGKSSRNGHRKQPCDWHSDTDKPHGLITRGCLDRLFLLAKLGKPCIQSWKKRCNPVREFPPVGSPSVLKGGHSTSQLVHLVITEKSPKWDIPYVFVTFVVTCRNHCQLWWTSSAPICRLFHESEAGCRRFAWSLRSPLPKKVAIMVIWRSGSYLGAKNNHEFGWLMLRLIYTVYTWHTQDTHKYQFLCGWAFLWLDWVLSQQLRMHESISAKKKLPVIIGIVFSKPVGAVGLSGAYFWRSRQKFPDNQVSSHAGTHRHRDPNIFSWGTSCLCDHWMQLMQPIDFIS